MIFSMTGFATKTIEVPALTNNKAYLVMTLKSLNSRFFEATCKLPHALQSLEIEFIKLLKDTLQRGKVSFIITMSNPLLFKGPIEPSLYMIESYLHSLEKIQKKYSIPGTISIAELINLPNIFIEEEVTCTETMVQLILTSTQQLIAELRHEQLQEGRALQKDIEERITELNKEITAIELLAAHVMEKNKEEAHNKLKELEKSTPEVIELTKHQLFSTIERMDISEEIVRFKSHLYNLSEIISSSHLEKGRRIDFTLQELTREINTIGSKSTDTTVGARTISIKFELEKIREQAQNIV